LAISIFIRCVVKVGLGLLFTTGTATPLFRFVKGVYGSLGRDSSDDHFLSVVLQSGDVRVPCLLLARRLDLEGVVSSLALEAVAGLAFPLRMGLGDQSSSLRRRARGTRSGCHTTGLWFSRPSVA
jgi:hypothetical protein